MTIEPEGPIFLGRGDELDFLLAEEGTEGYHTFVTGPRGIGRTALLWQAASAAASRPGSVVLRACGVAAEADAPHALLHRLVSPLLASPHLSGLPAASRAREAFAAGSDAGEAAGEAVRQLMATAVGEAPLLAVVDDVHLADPESQRVLAALAGAGDTTVRLLLSAPGERIPALWGEDWRSLRLGPLPPAAAARLLDSLPGAPGGRERVEILLAAEGNPLAVVEFARAAADLSGAAGSRPSTSSAREDFVASVQELPPATRHLLLLAALAGDGASRSRIAAAAGVPRARWTPACEAGLVELRGDRFTFTHPLARAAASSAPIALRQQAHACLAGALPAGDPQRLRHLAHAAFGADEALAAALEEQAERALDRGEFLEAARDFEAASELGDVAAHRLRRRAKAMFSSDRYGDRGWTRQSQRRFLRDSGPSGYDARVAALVAKQHSRDGWQRQAMHTVTAALATLTPGSAEHAALTSVAAQIAAESGLAAHRAEVRNVIGEASRARAASHPASAIRPEPPAATPDDWPALSYVFAAAVAAGGDGPLGEAGGVPSATVDPRAPADRLVTEALLACHLDRPDLALGRFALALRKTDPAQAGGLYQEICLPYVAALMDTGRFRSAADLARRGLELAAVHGNVVATVKIAAMRAMALAILGHGTEAKRLADGLPDLDYTENRAAQCLVVRARAMVSGLHGDFESTYFHVRGLFAPDGEPSHPLQAVYGVVPLALSAQRAGYLDDAAVCVTALRAASGPRPPRQTALLDYAQALTCDPAEAEQLFLRALQVFESGPWPYDLALARSGYGAWLRRRRRGREAREELDAAQATFSRLGSPVLAGLLAGELRATGGGAAGGARGPEPLTPQQRQVALLAADGLRNPEIARHLMLSPHTVRCHLYRVFHKLGINDRRQLAAALPPEAPAF
jgi:DNA-binding CsgD family transcriptional regulator